MQKNKDFIKLFKKQEGKVLLGENSQNLKYLSLIFLLTFLVIGFATGSRYYLAKKVNSPFVKLVEMEILTGHLHKMNEMRKDLSTDSLKKRYNYKKIEPYKNYPLTVCYHQNSDKKGSDNITGRTIEYDNILLDKIYKDNEFKGAAFGRGKKEEGIEDVGLIVTKKMLSKFGYPHDATYLLLNVSTDLHNGKKERTYTKVPVPIRAITESLPSSKEIIFTPYFYHQISPNIKKNRTNSNTFDPSLYHLNKKQLHYLLNTSDEAKIEDFLDIANNFFESERNRLNWGKMRAVYDDDHDFNTGTWVSMWFNDSPDSLSLHDMNMLHNSFIESKRQQLIGFDFTRVFQYNFSKVLNNQLPDYDHLSISLENLTNVEQLRTFLTDKYELKIDLSQVKVLKNYNFVATLTIIICFVLIIFSVFSISLFVSNLLSTHLGKIKMNLGTFKAFGLDNLTLQHIYKLMIWELVFKSAMIGFVTAFLLGETYFMKLILHLFIFAQHKIGGVQSSSIEICNGGFFCEKYFSIFNFWILLSIIIISIIIHLTLDRVIKKILQKNPGDLIYNR